MPKLKLGGKICPKFKMGGEKKRGGQTPDWGGQIFQKFFEGGKTHFSYPLLDPCACMLHGLHVGTYLFSQSTKGFWPSCLVSREMGK